MREISDEWPSTSASPPVDIKGESVYVIDKRFEEFVPWAKKLYLFHGLSKSAATLE